MRTRASDAGWLNGNISKRAVDLVPCSRSAPLLSQISSSFCLISHPFPSNSFFENMRHRCIQNSLLPVPIEYILVQRVLRPAEAVAPTHLSLYVGTGLAEGSTLRTRASDAGWLNGNISKRVVDLVPCLRFVPLRSQISSSSGSSATPLFLWIPFRKHAP